MKIISDFAWMLGGGPTHLRLECDCDDNRHKQDWDKWTHWGLNPGPSACEADVIPLHHVPLS